MFRKGFSIGRLYGINIRIDWSWLFIMLLVTWNLTAVFGQLHPDWSQGMRVGLGLLAALLFFASVLAHELAHSLVAKSQGLPVRNITLFLFGGVSNIQREPESPAKEFWMAIAGPLTSLILGVIMLFAAIGGIFAAGGLGAAGQMGVLSRLSPVNTLLAWLGSINIILGLFNLVPGFPLDGGRVLRSVFWAITHNLRQATRWAAFVGQAVAWVLIAAGIAMAFGLRIPFFGTGLISGLWLAFIGWFLNSASIQSYQQVAIQDILDGVTVNRLMRRNPPTVEPDCTINDLVHAHLMQADDQAFPVLEEGRLVGIVTVDDIRKAPRETWNTTRVGDIMTPEARLITTRPEEDAAKAMETLVQRDVRQLPVVSSSKEFVGLLRRGDIMRWLQLQSGPAGSSQPK